MKTYKTLYLRIPDTLYEQIGELAGRNGLTLNGASTLLLRAALDVAGPEAHLTVSIVNPDLDRADHGQDHAARATT